ncbi:MAG: CocE/NonD family hydrolase [Actinomycetota bacterium]
MLRSRACALWVSASVVLVGAPAVHARPSERARPTYQEFTYERVRVPMRDGVELAADIWRPVTPKGVEVPVILTLTPYHALYKALDPRETDLPAGDARLLVLKGYAYVLADVRGTYASGGCWNYGGRKERRDGYDLVEWLGTQPWSNGRVAMTGGSYDGTTANAAAVERPPHLATIIPISAISRWWGYAYQQGARSTYSGESADADPPSDTPTDFMMGYGFLPPPDPAAVTEADQVAMRWRPCNRVKKLMRGYSTEPDYTSFWMHRDYLHLARRVEVPVLVSHGQLDFNVKTWEGTQWFEAIRTEKMMVLGQWAHASPRGRFAGWDLLLERWLERWLYGVRNGVEDEPGVHVQTNDGEWRVQERWGGRDRSFALDGGTVSYLDDGTLTESEMTRAPGGTRFIRVTVPGTGGLRFAGRPVLHLSASSDRTSTHFVALLCDVGPDGRCSVISRAFMNARYRGVRRRGGDLEPGRRYTFNLEFIDKDYVVAEDHHLELVIASSSDTWVAPDEQRATNTLYLQDSRLSLPVVR